MRHPTFNNKKYTLAYIVPYIASHSNAISVNISRRKKVLENLGYIVCLIEQKNTHFFSTLRFLWSNKQCLNGIMIRIDGTCMLDKYTILKLICPGVPLIWEIHGFPEERLIFTEDIYEKWFVWKNNMKRRFLSYLVDACIFISNEIQLYANEKIHLRKTAIIPNFVQTPIENHSIGPRHALSYLLKNNCRVVLWGGSGDLPWQALDIIQKTADVMYKLDKHIIFVIVGSNYWHPMKSEANMLLLNPMSPEQFLQLVSIAHICLALYHKPKFFPFYFCPMKILDYMSMEKAVIATNLGTIPKLIQNGYNGFLTNNAIKDISAKILLITRDAMLSQKLSRNAKKAVAMHFNHTVAQKQYSALLQSLSI